MISPQGSSWAHPDMADHPCSLREDSRQAQVC